MPRLTINTPVGLLTIVEKGCAIKKICWSTSQKNEKTKLLLRAKKELENYFGGKLTRFTVPINPYGTSFQRKVWNSMAEIPFGKTATYGQIASTLHTSPRAVGNACSKNPLPIIIPCHRVIGGNGALNGYTGGKGLKTKLLLINHENNP